MSILATELIFLCTWGGSKFIKSIFSLSLFRTHTTHTQTQNHWKKHLTKNVGHKIKIISFLYNPQTILLMQINISAWDSWPHFCLDYVNWTSFCIEIHIKINWFIVYQHFFSWAWQSSLPLLVFLNILGKIYVSNIILTSRTEFWKAQSDYQNYQEN